GRDPHGPCVPRQQRPLAGRPQGERHLHGPVRTPLALVALVALGGVAGTPGHAAARSTVTVRLGEVVYRPATVTVHVGQGLRVVGGRIQHTVADTTAGWKTVRSKLIVPRPLSRGQAQTVRFSKPGTVWYVCTFHPTLMRGEVVVVP